MKSQSIVVLLILIFFTQSYPQVICLTDHEFTCPEISRRAGVSASFGVRFDIKGFQPENLEITGLDSLSSELVDMYKSDLTGNLKNLVYLRDTIGFSIKVRFIIESSQRISHAYAGFISDNELDFHFPLRRNLIADEGFTIPVPDPTLDSVFINIRIEYKSGKAPPADILVQRLFEDGTDRSVIIRNNYPNLEKEIYSTAQRYTKESFLHYGPRSKYFFIRYHVTRHVRECGYEFVY